MSKKNNENDVIYYGLIPRACYFGCPYDVPMSERQFCWCKWYIDNWDNRRFLPVYSDN